MSQEQIVNSIFAKHRACRNCLKAKAKVRNRWFLLPRPWTAYRVVEMQIEYMGVVRTDEDLTHPLKCPSMEEIVTILNQITEADNELARTKQLEELGYGEYDAFLIRGESVMRIIGSLIRGLCDGRVRVRFLWCVHGWPVGGGCLDMLILGTDQG